MTLKHKTFCSKSDICKILMVLVGILLFIFCNFDGYPSGFETSVISQSKQPRSILSESKPESIPSLVLMGPPKAGTRTFVNTLSKYSNIEQFGREFGFWTNGNSWKCYPRWSEQEWLQYIDDYSANKQSLSYLVSAMQSFSENKRCTIERYHSLYDKLNKSCSLSECHYIEKTPIYSRTPWISMIYSNLLPKVKLITILRNPINHIWSNVFAFSSKSAKNEKGFRKIERWIIKEFNQTNSLLRLFGMCKNMNAESNALSSKTMTERHSFMMARYKQFVVEYLKVFVKRMKKGTRLHIFKWAPFLLPNLLIGLLSYEEELRIFDHFKVIQFEYMYSETANAMSSIRCWMTSICGDDDVEKNYLFDNVERANSAAPKNNSFSKWYENEVHKLFDPCTKSMLNLLLNDRRDLLIGEWYEWN